VNVCSQSPNTRRQKADKNQTNMNHPSIAEVLLKIAPRVAAVVTWLAEEESTLAAKTEAERLAESVEEAFLGNESDSPSQLEVAKALRADWHSLADEIRQALDLLGAWSETPNRYEDAINKCIQDQIKKIHVGVKVIQASVTLWELGQSSPKRASTADIREINMSLFRS
jgi:hypothetical protein